MPAPRPTSRTASSRVTLSVAAMLCASLAAPALAQFAPGFQTFQAPEGLAWAPAMLSDDGTTVSGNVFIPRTNIINGFTLTPTTYTQFAESGTVFDISNAGTYTSLYNGRRAADGTIEVLDPSVTQPTGEGVGSSISRDGRTIAASNQIQPPGSSPTSNRAYRWTEGFGVTILPQYRPGAAFTEALDISGNGQVIVGSGRMSTFADKEAWVWTESNGLTILQDAPGSTFVSYQANAINNDGSIVAGFGVDTGVGLRGLIWRDGGVTPLPAPSGYRTATVHDLSDDGQVIVGQLGNSNSGLPTTDAVWTDATGWVPIFDYLRSRGVDVPLSYSSQNVDVSADGLTFAGTATDSITGERVVFVAVVPAPFTLAPLALLGLRRRARIAPPSPADRHAARGFARLNPPQPVDHPETSMPTPRPTSRTASSRVTLSVSAMLCASLAAPALAQGFAPGMHVYSLPTGLEWGVEPTVSEDGTAIGVGYFSPTSGGPNWGVTITPSAVTQFPEQSRVYDIADGGAYTVGFASRRSAAGVTDVIIPGAARPSGSEVRTSISGDGSVVAGTLEDSSFSFQAAYRWTEQSGLQYLGGYRPGAAYTRVYAVSRDGSTIVGRGSASLFSEQEAWKWTVADGFSVLPDLPDSTPGMASAIAANSDGSVIVGSTGDPTFGFRGIVWRDNQILALPTIPGWRSAEATDLSDDGSIIVGSLSSSLVGLPETAAIWTQATNWVPALDYFRMHGVDIPAYYSPQFSRFTVSADGTTFSSLLTDTRTNEQILAVVVIPSPGIVPLLGMACIFSRRARPHRAAIAH